VNVIWYFVFFLVSGFCGILYELIWLRLSMAQFGVTTPLVSIVLSMFMAGLGIGSWAAGALIRRYEDRSQFPPLRLYAVSELLIGISALVVPAQLLWGHRLLEHMSGQVGISSGTYYLVAGAWLALTLIPWCACMGATIPLAMYAIRHDQRTASQKSFSFLYVANLVGAVAGALIPLLFIETYGFRGTLHIGTVLNFTVALGAVFLSLGATQSATAPSATAEQANGVIPVTQKGILILLFLSGLTTMGMEVVWIRLYTPRVGPMVYSFALILASYLFATFAGSRIYRFWSRWNAIESRLAWISISLLGLLPLLMTDLRVAWRLPTPLCVFFGIMPVSCVIGFLTPMLVDRWSLGDPGRAGRAYAVNVLGCILGPLVAGFILLPVVGERYALLIFIAPYLVMPAFPVGANLTRPVLRVAAYAMIAASMVILFWTNDFETIFPRRIVLRDSSATVIATGFGPLAQKQLLVNGIPMTSLTLITKVMAHLTLASHQNQPQNTLVICFGMGTTFRSSLSWGVDTTVVDLIPSVPKLFPYFHADAPEVLASPLAHIVTDDGRRFLERTSKTFDSIIVDPPPPVPAAGSSLLYSEEFYALVKQHLRTGGIFQQWIPEGDRATESAVAQALRNSFPYIRTFRYTGNPGIHYLASTQPIPVRTPAELASRLPAKAVADFVEWGPYNTAEQQFQILIPDVVSIDALVQRSPGTPPLRDDRPINEYFALRARGGDYKPESF
jgi:spermidine synthase